MSAVAAAAPMPASPQSNWLEEEGLAVARLGAETAGCELGAGPDTGSAWINLADACIAAFVPSWSYVNCDAVNVRARGGARIGRAPYVGRFRYLSWAAGPLGPGMPAGLAAVGYRALPADGDAVTRLGQQQTLRILRTIVVVADSGAVSRRRARHRAQRHVRGCVEPRISG